MRKYIIAILLMAPVLTGAVKMQQAIRQEKLIGIINDYKRCDGFDIVKLGPVGTSAIKGLIRVSEKNYDSQEVKDALSIINGVKIIAIVEYEECSEDIREKFNYRIFKALESSELLMEVKDGSEVMKMYGLVSENTAEVKDFILFSPEDCTLICLFGSIPIDAISKIAAK